MWQHQTFVSTESETNVNYKIRIDMRTDNNCWVFCSENENKTYLPTNSCIYIYMGTKGAGSYKVVALHNSGLLGTFVHICYPMPEQKWTFISCIEYVSAIGKNMN